MLLDIWNDFTKLEQVLCASLAGVVERVNKLISVTPVKTRFFVKLFEIIILTSNVQGTMVKLAMLLWGGWLRCNKKDGRWISSLVWTAYFFFPQVGTDSILLPFQLFSPFSESSWWRAPQKRR